MLLDLRFLYEAPQAPAELPTQGPWRKLYAGSGFELPEVYDARRRRTRRAKDVTMRIIRGDFDA